MRFRRSGDGASKPNPARPQRSAAAVEIGELDLDAACDLRIIRDQWLACLSEAAEHWMRSPAFLRCLRYGLAFYNVQSHWPGESSARATSAPATIDKQGETSDDN